MQPTEGQGLAGWCIPRCRQAGRQAGGRTVPAGLKGCRNVEGFRGKQQEATWSSGQGLSHPPPPPKALLLFCLLLPLACLPLFPRTKAVFSFFLPCLVAGCGTQTPWPHLPHLFRGCCLNRHEGLGWNSRRSHLEQHGSCSA